MMIKSVAMKNYKIYDFTVSTGFGAFSRLVFLEYTV